MLDLGSFNELDMFVTQRPSDLDMEKGEAIFPCPAKRLELVRAGDRVKIEDPLIILESMKMEIAVRADRDGRVLQILIEEGTGKTGP